MRSDALESTCKIGFGSFGSTSAHKLHCRTDTIRSLKSSDKSQFLGWTNAIDYSPDEPKDIRMVPVDTFDEQTTTVSDHETELGPPTHLVICRYCEAVLAYLSDAIEVSGQHEYVKINPFGHQHHFRCFSEALGCSLQGPREYADSWFPGYTWQLAICAACNSHVGWLFEGNNHFYGLINNRVTTTSSGSPDR